MAITRLNSLAIPAGTVETADLSYPLTNFSSTGIDDNATSTAITIDSSENVGIGTTNPSSLGLLAVGDGATGTKTIAINGSGSSTSVMDIDFRGGGTGGPAGRVRFESSTKDLSFWTGNYASIAQRMTITDSGNVGIGTDSPAYKLDVQGGAMTVGNGTIKTGVSYDTAGRLGTLSNHDLKIITNNAVAATVTTGGNVGIGTTSPDTLLHISDTSPHIDIGPQGGNRGKIGYHDLDVYIGSTSSTGEIIFKNNIGSTDSPQTSGDTKMVITDTGVGIGTTSPSRQLVVYDSTQSNIALQNSGSGTTLTDGFQMQYDGTAYLWNYENSAMLFGTNNNERMRIDSSGKLLVGTTSNPDNRFDLATNPNAGRGAEVGRISMGRQGSGYPHIGYNAGPTGTNGFVNKYIADTSSWIHFSNASIIFNRDTGTTAAGAITGTESMRIDTSGKVGVGITNPSGSFHVTTKDSSGSDVYYVAQNTTSNRIAGYRILDESNNIGGVFQYDNGGNNLLIGTTIASSFQFITNNQERLRIEAGGNVTVRSGGVLSANRPDNTRDTKIYTDNGAGYLQTSVDPLHIQSANRLVFFTNGANERMRIDTSGNVGIGTTNPGWRLHVHNTQSSYVAGYFTSQSSSTTEYGLLINLHNDPNDATRYFLVGRGNNNQTTRFHVASNGNVTNTNNSYGAISDEKLKENIVDSGSQWDDIKALRVRKYSMKEDALDAPNKLGVIAQEVEAAGMQGLVIDSTDMDENNNDLGTTTKTVNYSVLYMKAVKALQEAMTRIETLEAEVAALKGA